MNSERFVNLYFARHGKTSWNELGVLQSHTDSRVSVLTPEGKQQARMLKEKLSHVSFPRVYASRYVRALETAAIVADGNTEVIPAPALVERSFGHLEGTQYKESMAMRHSFLVHQNDPDYLNVHGIETDEQLQNRVIPFLEKIAVAHLGLNVLFVTHSGIMRYLIHELLGASYEDLKDVNIQETAYMHIRLNLEHNEKRYEYITSEGVRKNGSELATIIG